MHMISFLPFAQSAYAASDEKTIELRFCRPGSAGICHGMARLLRRRRIHIIRSFVAVRVGPRDMDR